MRERPILMNGQSVRTILNGRKTQTRRVMKPQPVLGRPWKNWIIDPEGMDLPLAYCPYGIPEDRLWVRETFHVDRMPDGRVGALHYRADRDVISQSWKGQWKPSIFMPRWASRILLEIVAVRVERVQDITEGDTLAEGIALDGTSSGRIGFATLWNSINEKRGYGWNVDPWVWVVEFDLL